MFIIDLGFQKFMTKKLQTTITFDSELELRWSKNESCSKWGNEALGQQPDKGCWPLEIPKFHCLGFF